MSTHTLNMLLESLGRLAAIGVVPSGLLLKEEAYTGWVAADMAATRLVAPTALIHELVLHLDWRRGPHRAELESRLRALPWLSSGRSEQVTRLDGAKHQQVLLRFDLAVLSGPLAGIQGERSHLTDLRPPPVLLVEVKSLQSQSSLTKAMIRTDAVKLGLAREVMLARGLEAPACAVLVFAQEDGERRANDRKQGRTTARVREWLDELAGESVSTMPPDIHLLGVLPDGVYSPSLRV